MRGAAPTLLLILSLVGDPVASSSAQPADCGDWQACQAQVEDALTSGAFERAHDLAWRAVQTGPKDDPSLMFLLARAQSRAGRPHDALVMVRRLAERRVVTEALTHPDLERTRELPGWPAVEALVTGAGLPASAAVGPSSAAASAPASVGRPSARAPAPAALPTPLVAPAGGPRGVASESAPLPAVAPPGAAVPVPAAVSPAPLAMPPMLVPVAEVRVPLSSHRFTTAGLAYDAVSHRFVVGDRDGRKIRVVGEGLDEAVDLVRAESAGFSSIRALAIDARRGDLWVASADPVDGTASLHRLQLISGRPLKAYALDAAQAPVVPVDLAVTAGGTVLVLDEAGRILRLKPGAGTVEVAVANGVGRATSLAAGVAEAQVFVAHADGIARVSLSSGTVTPLAGAEELSLAGFLRLRLYRDGLVGLQVGADDKPRLVALRLAAGAGRVRSATVFAVDIDAAAGSVTLAVTGDEVAVVGEGPAQDPASNPASPPPPALVVRRFRLP